MLGERPPDDHARAQVGPRAIGFENLFIQVTLWDALVLTIVVVAFILAVFVFSTRVGEAAPPTTASSDLGLEIAWTLGPALILLMITIPTVRTIFRSQPAVAPAGALEIKVIAHQWWWEFHYPDGLKTSNETAYSNQPADSALAGIRRRHPQLLGAATRRQARRRAGPDQRAHFHREHRGMYPGQCAEFCGLSHANMRFRVFVDTPEDFAEWDEAQLAGPVIRRQTIRPLPTAQKFSRTVRARPAT